MNYQDKSLQSLKLGQTTEYAQIMTALCYNLYRANSIVMA